MKIFSQIKGKKTAKDSVLTLAGNTIAQVLSLCVAIIVSRVFSVAEYGLYCILNNISSFVTDMADMGMNGAITRFVAEFRAKGKKEDEEQIIAYSIKRKLINLLVVFVVLVLGSKPIAKYWLHDSSLYYYIYLIIITCAFSLFVGALRAILQGRQEFGKYFITLVAWNGVWCLAILAMVFTNNLSVLSSILAGAISGVVNLLIGIKLTNTKIKNVFQTKKIQSEVKRSFNNFGNWMLLWALFAILQSKMDVFMLATFATSEQVSYYDIASKVIKPILMVVSAYAQVLNPQFATIAVSELGKRIKTVMKFILLISALIVLAIVLIKPIITLVFGNKYEMSIVPAQLLLFAIIFYVWTVPFNSALYALKKPYVFTIAAFIGLLVTVIGDYFLLGRYGAIGAAITFIAAQIVGLVVAVVAYIVIMRKGKILDESSK